MILWGLKLFYWREQYEHPLPSREYILQILAEKGVPLEQDDLIAISELGFKIEQVVPEFNFK